MAYYIVKWIHILAFVTAIGANITYGVWLTQAKKQSENLLFTLKGIRLLDSRLVMISYILLLLTGFYMQGVSHLALSTPWLLLSLILYVILIVIAMFLYTPNLKNQIRIVESQGYKSSDYASISRKSKILGMVMALLALIISFLMVVKPSLW
jgi:uncharacterized membrane protein